MYDLPVWLDPPDDKDASDRGQIIKHVLMESQVQVDDLKAETAAAEAAKVDKDDGHEDDKDDDKDTKLKSKCTTHRGKRGQKNSSPKKVDIADDNLNEFFSSSQKKNSQETPHLMNLK